MPPSSIPTAYSSEQAGTYETERFSSLGGRHVHAAEAAFVEAAYARLDAPSITLEVGVGTGRLVSIGVEHGHAVVGVDASLAMMSEGRRLRPEVTYEPTVGSALDLPFRDAGFDLTYCLRLLSQTESAAYALGCVREMLRVTRPGGICLVEFLGAARPRARTTIQVKLSIDEVVDVCRAAGADVLDVSGRFVLGMTAMRRCPPRLVAGFDRLDAWLSARFTTYCSRVYVTVRTGSPSPG